MGTSDDQDEPPAAESDCAAPGADASDKELLAHLEAYRLGLLNHLRRYRAPTRAETPDDDLAFIQDTVARLVGRGRRRDLRREVALFGALAETMKDDLREGLRQKDHGRDGDVTNERKEWDRARAHLDALRELLEAGAKRGAEHWAHELANIRDLHRSNAIGEGELAAHVRHLESCRDWEAAELVRSLALVEVLRDHFEPFAGGGPPAPRSRDGGAPYAEVLDRGRERLKALGMEEGDARELARLVTRASLRPVRRRLP